MTVWILRPKNELFFATQGKPCWAGRALYPTLHEGLSAKLFLWNCIPPTFGLLVIGTAFERSRPRIIASATFALLTAVVATVFSAAWFFTPLDLDPHSSTTKLVFVFAPVFSLGLAAIASGIAWFMAQVTDSQ